MHSQNFLIFSPSLWRQECLVVVYSLSKLKFYTLLFYSKVVYFLYQMAQTVPPVLYSCFPSNITLEHAGRKKQKWRGGSKHTAWKEMNTSPVNSIFINSQKGDYTNFITMLQTWTICSSKSAAILRRLASNLWLVITYWKQIHMPV